MSPPRSFHDLFKDNQAIFLMCMSASERRKKFLEEIMEYMGQIQTCGGPRQSSVVEACHSLKY